MFKYRAATVTAVATVAALLSLATHATEEVTMDGTAIAQAAAANKASFQADMAEYARALQNAFTAEMEAELRSSTTPRLRVASVSRVDHRG